MAHAYYLSYFDKSNRSKIIDSFNIWVNSSKTPKFDAIAVCGLSGLTFGPLLAHLYNKELIVIRKQDDQNNHSNRIVESIYNPESKFRYIILDDLISSAATAYYMKSVLDKFSKKSKLVGMWRYDIYEEVGIQLLEQSILGLEEFYPSKKEKIDKFLETVNFDSFIHKENW